MIKRFCDICNEEMTGDRQMPEGRSRLTAELLGKCISQELMKRKYAKLTVEVLTSHNDNANK